MLDDNELIPLCHRWARKLLPQAKHLGDRETAFNELVNEGYISAKGMTSISGASTVIMWSLIRFVKIKAPKDLVFDSSDNQINRASSSSEPVTNRLKDGQPFIDKRVCYDSEEPSACDCAIRKEQQRKLLRSILDLDETELIVILRYFRDEKTFIEIGEEFSLSREWARKKVNAVLEKLRFLIGE